MYDLDKYASSAIVSSQLVRLVSEINFDVIPSLRRLARLGSACVRLYALGPCGKFATALAVDAIGELDPMIPFLSAIVTGVGFASMPFWIYRGYGHFLFERTCRQVI